MNLQLAMGDFLDDDSRPRTDGHKQSNRGIKG